MTKLKSLLAHRNIGLRLLSLALAFFLWFVVLTLIDPPARASFTVSLELMNEDALARSNKILQNETELLTRSTIKIEVEGSTSAIDNLSRKIAAGNSPLRAYIDLNKAEILNATQIGEYIATNVIVPDFGTDVSITRYDPPEIGIMLDKITTRTFPVTITELGTVADGYIAQSALKKSSPETIRIRGANITLAAINYMSIEVSINNATGDVVVTDIPKAYDEAGNEITDFEFVSEETATVTVPVYKTAIISVQQPTIKGEPAEGYAVASTPDWSPKQITVVGPVDEINKRKPIVLEPIDVTGRAENFTEEYSLRAALDKNLSIVNEEEETAVAAVFIEPEISKELVIPVTSLTVFGLTPGIEFLTESIPVTVYGRQSLVEPLTEIPGVIQLLSAELTEPGEHDVLVDWRPRGGVSVISEPVSIQILVREPDEETETVDNGADGDGGVVQSD